MTPIKEVVCLFSKMFLGKDYDSLLEAWYLKKNANGKERLKKNCFIFLGIFPLEPIFLFFYKKHML